MLHLHLKNRYDPSIQHSIKTLPENPTPVLKFHQSAIVSPFLCWHPPLTIWIWSIRATPVPETLHSTTHDDDNGGGHVHRFGRCDATGRDIGRWCRPNRCGRRDTRREVIIFSPTSLAGFHITFKTNQNENNKKKHIKQKCREMGAETFFYTWCLVSMVGIRRDEQFC